MPGVRRESDSRTMELAALVEHARSPGPPAAAMFAGSSGTDWEPAPKVIASGIGESMLRRVGLAVDRDVADHRPARGLEHLDI